MHGPRESCEAEEDVGSLAYSKLNSPGLFHANPSYSGGGRRVPLVNNAEMQNMPYSFFGGGNAPPCYIGGGGRAQQNGPASINGGQQGPHHSHISHHYNYSQPCYNSYQQQQPRGMATNTGFGPSGGYQNMGNYDSSVYTYQLPYGNTTGNAAKYLSPSKDYEHFYANVNASPGYGAYSKHHKSTTTAGFTSPSISRQHDQSPSPSGINHSGIAHGPYPSSPSISIQQSGNRMGSSFTVGGIASNSTSDPAFTTTSTAIVHNTKNDLSTSEELAISRADMVERQARCHKNPVKPMDANVDWVALDISGMQLRSLAPEIKYYSQLISLNLQKNSLRSLPSEIGLLTQLRVLDLSNNQLTSLTPQIGKLIHLVTLNVENNLINELPIELGKCFRIETFAIKGNPIESQLSPPDGPILYIKNLREKLPVPPTPPPRSWVLNGEYDRQMFKSYLEHWESYLCTEGIKYIVESRSSGEGGVGEVLSEVRHKKLCMSFAPQEVLEEMVKKNRVPVSIRLMCFNVLADLYARSECASYCCPIWALEWEYRKGMIIKEIIKYAPDVVCLQEVETEQYQSFFEPELASHGYRGFFYPKSRSRNIKDRLSRVDGCATFYMFDSFDLIKVEYIDFREDAQLYNKFQLNEFKRLISKDNVSLAIILRRKKNCEQQLLTQMNCMDNMKFEDILIVNTHIHWDPRFCDVKVMQVNLLLERIEALVEKYTIQNHPLPILLAGDFNSIPNSAVYELLSKGSVSIQHEDFMGYDYGFPGDKGPEHRLLLASSRAFIGYEPVFTNYTPEFVGCLDYIWFSTDSLIVERILDGVNEKLITEMSGALPNPHMPSDHIPLVADFVFKQFNQPTKYHPPSPYPFYRYH